MKYVLVVTAYLHQTGLLYGIPSSKGFHEEFDASDDAKALKEAKGILRRFSRQFPRGGSTVGTQQTLQGYNARLYSVQFVSEMSAGLGKKYQNV